MSYSTHYNGPGSSYYFSIIPGNLQFKSSFVKAILFVILIVSFYTLPVSGQINQNDLVNIHLAVLQNNIEGVKENIEAGTDINAKDQFGSTPLIIAATFGRIEISKLLIDAGADLNIQSNEGSTALHIASVFGRIEIVKSLLERGAERSIRNNFGSTAYDLAAVPVSVDKKLFAQMLASLGPLGLQLDEDNIKSSRPEIAEMLRPENDELADVNYAPANDLDWKTSTPAEQGVDPMLIAELYHDAGKMDNLYGLLVIKNGYLIAENYFNKGSMTKKARLQSVTKSFTSALVGIACDQGIIQNPDQKMMEFFPEFADSLTDKRKEQITVREMLQMRAGYPWEESSEDLFNILYAGFKPHYLIDFPLTINPGEGFQYSNLTSHLLGIITARASNQDLLSFGKENLFNKMKAEPGKWIKDWKGYYNGHGDLHLTARDIAKFGLLYLNNGKFEGQQIISEKWVNESLQNYSSDAWITKDSINYIGRYFRDLGYGYQWWSAAVDDHRFSFAWGHGGQLIILLDKPDMVIVVTSNPFARQEDNELSWKQERCNFNLVGKFIHLLIKES